MPISRNCIIFGAFMLTSVDFFHYFVQLSRGWVHLGRFLFLSFGVSVAMLSGTLIACALLSLCEGTSFLKGLVDYEPETTRYKLY